VATIAIGNSSGLGLKDESSGLFAKFVKQNETEGFFGATAYSQTVVKHLKQKTMKKILVIILIASINISCSSDEEQTQDNDIIGLWKIIDYNDNQFSNIEEVEAVDEPCFSLQTKKYNSNGELNFFYKYGNACQSTGVTNKVFSVEGDLLTETVINGGFEPNSNYVVKYTIEELSSNILKLKGIYVNEGNVGEEGNVDDPFYETWERIE
jgi:hypothetical protein